MSQRNSNTLWTLSILTSHYNRVHKFISVTLLDELVLGTSNNNQFKDQFDSIASIEEKLQLYLQEQQV